MSILITGATGRLGSAFARSIVASGRSVFLVDIDESKGRQLVVELGIQQADFLVADITTVPGIQNAIQSCVARFGRVDAVVRTAYPRSAGWGSTLENLKPEHLFEDLGNQLGGVILLSQQVISQFQHQGGGHADPHLLNPKLQPPNLSITRKPA